MSNECVDTQSLPTFSDQHRDKKCPPCPKPPGTVLRIFIPAGAEINLLDLIEVSSPGGICIIVRLPFLRGQNKHFSLADIQTAVQKAGGTIEVV
jgi:hypothetical protein